MYKLPIGLLAMRLDEKPLYDWQQTDFGHIDGLTAADGCMENVKAVIEYTLPGGGEKDSQLTDYRFSIVPCLSFGSNEGIYLKLYLEGSFDSSGRKEAHIGTVKTLRTDLGACQLIGNLGGALMYFAAQHVSQNLHRYTPKQELVREYTRRLAATMMPL